MNRRTFIKRALATAVAGTAGVSIYSYGIERYNLDRTVVRFQMGLTKPLRIAALGDIHFDPLYEESYIEEVVHCLTEMRPDVIIYTGDFVSHDVSRMKDLAALLSQAVSRLGSFAVLGNHDHWSGPWTVVDALENKGIRVLRNHSVAMPEQENCFITGIDSFWGGNPDLTILSKTPDDSRHLLVIHEPDPFAHLDDPRVKLQISGHTHGGQVRIPGVGALVLPKWGRTYQAGLYTEKNRSLYVNRGIGTLSPHVRFDCRPELTLFELS